MRAAAKGGAGREPQTWAVCFAPSHRCSFTGGPAREAAGTWGLYVAAGGCTRAGGVLCRPAAGKDKGDIGMTREESSSRP